MPIPAIIAALISGVANQAISEEEDPIARSLGGYGASALGSKLNANVQKINDAGDPIGGDSAAAPAGAMPERSPATSIAMQEANDNYLRSIGSRLQRYS